MLYLSSIIYKNSDFIEVFVFFTGKLTDMTLYNRVEYLDNPWLAIRRKINESEVLDSIDDFFQRDELANSVRKGEESYVGIADNVCNYLRRSMYGFGMNVLDDSEGAVETAKLIGSLRNVGVGELANPLRYLGNSRNEDRRTLDGILLIGLFFTGMSYVVAMQQGDNPYLSASVPGLGYGLIYAKMWKDSNRFVLDARKELPDIAKRSQDLVRRFSDLELK